MNTRRQHEENGAMAARQGDYKRVPNRLVETSLTRPPPAPHSSNLSQTLSLSHLLFHITLNMSISMYTTTEEDVGVRIQWLFIVQHGY